MANTRIGGGPVFFAFIYCTAYYRSIDSNKCIQSIIFKTSNKIKKFTTCKTCSECIESKISSNFIACKNRGVSETRALEHTRRAFSETSAETGVYTQSINRAKILVSVGMLAC
jgi:hypothetical protein